jgi:hypothetical protein
MPLRYPENRASVGAGSAGPLDGKETATWCKCPDGNTAPVCDGFRTSSEPRRKRTAERAIKQGVRRRLRPKSLDRPFHQH